MYTNKQVKIRTLLALIGFIIVVLGFIYCYMNPHVYMTEQLAHGFVSTEFGDIPLEGYVTIMQVNYWSQTGFLTMAIGLTTILFGLVLGDVELEDLFDWEQ